MDISQALADVGEKEKPLDDVNKILLQQRRITRGGVIMCGTKGELRGDQRQWGVSIGDICIPLGPCPRGTRQSRGVSYVDLSDGTRRAHRGAKG